MVLGLAWGPRTSSLPLKALLDLKLCLLLVCLHRKGPDMTAAGAEGDKAAKKKKDKKAAIRCGIRAGKWSDDPPPSVFMFHTELHFTVTPRASQHQVMSSK